MAAVWLAAAAFLLQIWNAALQEGVRDDSKVDNVVRQAVADEFSSEILTNRTRAFLSCASGEMVVKLNYSEPFRGITYTDYDRTSPCKFYGDGRKYYELRIPLKGCGTRQEEHRVFVNNIIVRFHRSLQLEEDEIKTIICRYPPPLAPVPPRVVAPILATVLPAAAVLPPKLSEVELLLIICALLFLTLLLLGIGVAYYCLKKRNIKVMKRKKAMSSAPPSVLTKLSESTMGSLMFDQIRIPRAIAQSTSGSEAALLAAGDKSDTIPSDYPSESPSSLSDTEEIDGHRSVLVSETSTTKHDRYRYENSAFVPDEGSVYSGYPVDQERADSVSSVPVTMVAKPPEKKRLKLAMEQILTTISEKEDILQQESMNRRRATVTNVRNEMHAPPRIRARPPSLYGSIPDNDNWSQSEMESRAPVQPFVRQPKYETATLTDYLMDTQEATDTQEDVTRHRETTYQQLEKAIVPRKPKITVQNIDDVYVTTTTETTATEHITKRVDESIEPIPDPQSPSWDVTIRHYPNRLDDQPLLHFPTTVTTNETNLHRTDLHTQDVPHPPPQWDVLIRVLQPPPIEGVEDLTIKDKEVWRSVITTDSTFRALIQEATTIEEYVRISTDSRYERLFHPQTWKTIIHILVTPPPHPPPQWDVLMRVLQPPLIEGVENLTIKDKEIWRSVITTDSTFRSLIQEATTIEEYVHISTDYRYEHLFHPQTWKTIIRILVTPPLNPPAEHHPHPPVHPPRYRKKSDGINRRPAPIAKSAADIDMRSVTETEIDVAGAEKESLWSVDTGYTYRTSRSIAERSTSEFVEDVPTFTRRPPSLQHTSEFPRIPESSDQYSNRTERAYASTTARHSYESGNQDDDDDNISSRYRSHPPPRNHYSSEFDTLHDLQDAMTSRQFSSSMARTERSYMSSAEDRLSETIGDDIPRSFRTYPPPLERSSSEFVTIPETITSGHIVSSGNISEMQRSSSSSVQALQSRRGGNQSVLERSSTEIIINSPLLEAVNTNIRQNEAEWKR